MVDFCSSVGLFIFCLGVAISYSYDAIVHVHFWLAPRGTLLPPFCVLGKGCEFWPRLSQSELFPRISQNS